MYNLISLGCGLFTKDLTLYCCYLTFYILVQLIHCTLLHHLDLDHGPTEKKRKRERQKVFKFTNKQLETRQCDEYVIGRVLPDEIGEDTDVMHMKLEAYTPNYLKECRHLLMKKVEEYRRTVEELQTEKAKQAVQHRNEIEEIRIFYRNIAYQPARLQRRC